MAAYRAPGAPISEFAVESVVDEIAKRDKLSLDLFWIKDRTLTDTDSLPDPDVLATEIADDLAEALEQFTKIATRLAKRASTPD